jgi:hypothetical protein
MISGPDEMPARVEDGHLVASTPTSMYGSRRRWHALRSWRPRRVGDSAKTDAER